MSLIARRAVLAAAATLASAPLTRKPRAAPRLRPLSDVIQKTDPPAPLPPIAFWDSDGAKHALSDYTGRGVVLNLWATWCAPCVAELPSLARTASALAPDAVAVLPLSSDRGGAKAVHEFFADHDIAGLPILIDPFGEAAEALKARGLPTSLIIDRQGRQVAFLEGAADWSAPEAIELIRDLTRQ